MVAVSGPAAAPVIVHRDQVTLLDDESLREPYHAATAVPRDDAPALIASVELAATASAEAAIRGFVSSLGATAVGVVGGDRRLPAELSKRLSTHALLHACERDLFERAIIVGAAQAGMPVTTIPATGKLFDQASDVLGVAVAPTLSALGKSVGSPWKKDHKEAAAAALLALDALA